MQQATATRPVRVFTDHPLHAQVGQGLPLLPVRQLIEIRRRARAPVEVHRILEAGRTAVLDQAVHLRHAGARGNQHQRPFRQLGQMGVAERQLNARQAVALQLGQQLQAAGFAPEDMQLQLAPAVRRRGQGKGRRLAARPLDHQVLPSVIARHLARRRTQAHPPDITANLGTLDQLTAEPVLRQLARRQHAIPVQQAVFQRFGQAGEQLAMLALLTALAHPPLNQQGRADMAIAVATALRAVITEASRAIENALAGLQLEYGAGGLQGDIHQSIPSSAHMASTRCLMASS